jgi:hypothetical protein
MTTYTTTADVNGNFQIDFGATAYTGGEQIKVKATSGTSEREIIINAPSELYGLAGIRFEGDFINFPGANLKMIVSGVKNITANAFYAANNNIFTKVTEIEVDDACESLGGYCFYDFNAVSFKVPAGLKTIGDGALYGNKNLQSFVMPDSVTSIGGSALSGCTRLINLVISRALENIPNNCFSGLHQIASVVFPASIKSLGSSACTSWVACNEIKLLSTVPPTIQANTFQGLKSTCVFKVPAASVAAYQAAPNWSAFAARIQAI